VKIFTHVHVDLDAVASVWAARQFIPGASSATVEFVSANWDGNGMSFEDIAVDIEAGGKGLKGEKDLELRVHSCFSLILKKYAAINDQLSLMRIASYIDLEESRGSVLGVLFPDLDKETRLMLSSANLNMALRSLYQIHGKNDQIVTERMSEIFSGIFNLGKEYMVAKEKADQAEIVGGLVAIIQNPGPGVNHLLFTEKNVRAIVYVSGNDLGIVRGEGVAARMDHSEVRRVVEKAGEEVGDGTGKWFAHSSGFLFCRGSRKSPAESLSKVNPHDLAEAIVRVLQEPK
jgi:hypothetical protein